jgi:uncharacterized membrane protein
MPSHRARPLHPVSLVNALRARPLLAGSAIVGIVLFVALQIALPSTSAAVALLAWNAGALLYLLLAWRAMAGATVETIQERAARQDEGRLAILLLVVLASLAVLLAVGTQLAQVRNLKGDAKAMHVGLAALTVLTSWLFTQVLFAQHYAHDFYAARMHGHTDPLHFPGTPEPGYADFFHFACVIGVAGQTADISFNGSGLRGVGTLHCIMAFFFNTTLLALSINIAAAVLL